MDEAVGESFPRQLRLTSAIDFQQVFKQNFRISDAGITILIGTKTGSHARVGFAIARKQIQKAVKRNALKRLFRESFRRNQHRLPARDMVIMVKKEILSAERPELQSRLDQHWNSIVQQCEKY